MRRRQPVAPPPSAPGRPPPSRRRPPPRRRAPPSRHRPRRSRRSSLGIPAPAPPVAARVLDRTLVPRCWPPVGGSGVLHWHRSELAGPEVLERLGDLLFGVHHEGPVGVDRLADRTAPEHQDVEAGRT